jgi:hypothetical protein
VTPSENRLQEQLDRLVPRPESAGGDWGDALARASARTRRQRKVLVSAALAAAVAVLSATALGREVGDFAWLTRSPGKPAGEEAQVLFQEQSEQRWSKFPDRPRLRELIRARLGDGTYTLYGFRTGALVCLRLIADGLPGAGPTLSCLPLYELELSKDDVIPLRGNVSLGHVGRLPRTIEDPPAVPRAIATYGFASGRAQRVDVISDRGPSDAILGGGAFLHVIDRPNRGEWARSAVSIDAVGNRRTIPIVVDVLGEPPVERASEATGPSRVERRVSGGKIGWLTRSSPPAFIRPNPRDFIRMRVALVGDKVCLGSSLGQGCQRRSQLFRRGPVNASYGFSGVGSQFAIIRGIASDDVARVQLFLATGERRPVPLKRNVLLVRVQRAKFPARLVAYDKQERVIAIETYRL